MKLLIFNLLILATVSLIAQVRYVTTIYPFKMIVGEVVGERGEVVGMLPPGASPHTYELKPSEIRKTQNATALFYGADNLDGWVLKLHHSQSISLIELLPMDNRLIIRTYSDRNNEKTSATDPHFWTDPLAVKAILPSLVDTLCGLDPEGCSVYMENSSKFSKQLDTLAHEVQSKFSQIQNREVILAHPFFQYFLKRFGLNIVGIIETIPGNESSPRELKQMIDRAREYKVSVILTHPQSSDRPAYLLAEATAAKVIELDPIGGVPGRETYEDLLLYNAQILLKALK